MKRKLIYIAIIVAFIFLTGGVKITYEKDIFRPKELVDLSFLPDQPKGQGFIILDKKPETILPDQPKKLEKSVVVDHRFKEIIIFGFYYKKDDATKINLGWEFYPSLKIFSISINTKFVPWYKIKKGGETD